MENKEAIEKQIEQIGVWDWRSEFRNGNIEEIKNMFNEYAQSLTPQQALPTDEEVDKRKIIKECLDGCDPDQLHDGSYITIEECVKIMNFMEGKWMRDQLKERSK